MNINGIDLLELVCQLFDQDFSLNDINHLLGLTIDELFLEDNFPNYTNLTKQISLQCTFKIIYKIEKFKRDFKKLLTKKLIYPTILIFLTVFIIFIFKFKVIPTIQDNFPINGLMLLIVNFLVSLVVVLILLNLILIFVYILFKYNTTYYLMYLNSQLPFVTLIKKILNLYIMIILSQSFDELQSTKELLSLLNNVSNKFISASIGFLISDALYMGSNLIVAVEMSFLNDDVKYILIKAIETNNFKHFVSIFVENKIKQIKIILENYTKYYLFFSYSLVGLTVVIMYQILLVPATSILNI